MPRLSHAGYLAAAFTVCVWGLTFVSTKVLLVNLLPIEILFIRFVVGLVALSILRPRFLRLSKRSHEGYFIVAGLTGVTLYFLLENVALQYLGASVVGITVSVAPLFTALIGMALGRERALGARFFIGFALAMTGIAIVSIGGAAEGGLAVAEGAAGWFGIGLCIVAALVWAVYSNVIAKISDLGYETIHVTKRTFAWGVVFMAVFLPIMGARPEALALAVEPVNLANLAFLGLGASATCFATWGFAVSKLGPARTAAFIYASPVITATASIVILGEPFTPLMVAGIALTLAGLAISQWRAQRQSENEPSAHEDAACGCEGGDAACAYGSALRKPAGRAR